MIILFLILGSIISVYLWFSEKKQVSLLYRSIGLIFLLVFFGISVYFLQDIEYLGEDEWYNRSPYREIILFLIMATGMIASVLNKAISELQKKKARVDDVKIAKLMLEIDRWDVLKPFLTSLFTFTGLLAEIGNQNLNLVTITLAFQAGFFWHTILKRN